MKIIGLVASPHGEKSATRRLVSAVLEGAHSAGAQIELVDLTKVRIGYCVACGTCYKTGVCPIPDDFNSIQARVLAADGVVWGSPNYFRSVSAQMKTYIDRQADCIHCQMMEGKYGCAVSVAGGPAFQEVVDYLNGIFVAMGGSSVGGAGASASIPESLESAEIKARGLGGELVKAITERRAYPEQEPIHQDMREHFKDLINANKDVWKHEFKYWQDKGRL